MKTIGPVDTCRERAWGSYPDTAEENTMIISINNSIGSMLTGDVRKNYFMVGTTWSNGVGTNVLANSTLETFEQAKNCFSCHRGPLKDGTLSHIFPNLQPLVLSP
jgi:hypothetical protein